MDQSSLSVAFTPDLRVMRLFLSVRSKILNNESLEASGCPPCVLVPTSVLAIFWLVSWSNSYINCITN